MANIQLRATLRLHNNEMITARQKLGLTMAQLADKSGVRLETLYELQRLDFSGASEDKACRIAAVLGIPVDKVLPDGVLGEKLESRHERVFDADVKALIESAPDRFTLPAPEDVADSAELKERVGKVLKSLTYREREIIKMRFGLDGSGEMTVDECGRVFNVSGKRARQIIDKAICKMQHPVRAEKLAGFLPVGPIR